VKETPPLVNRQLKILAARLLKLSSSVAGSGAGVRGNALRLARPRPLSTNDTLDYIYGDSASTIARFASL
jgi:hypothetical protein